MPRLSWSPLALPRRARRAAGVYEVEEEGLKLSGLLAHALPHVLLGDALRGESAGVADVGAARKGGAQNVLVPRLPIWMRGAPDRLHRHVVLVLRPLGHGFGQQADSELVRRIGAHRVPAVVGSPLGGGALAGRRDWCPVEAEPHRVDPEPIGLKASAKVG